MVFFLSLFLLPSSMAGEPWCEGPWLRTSVDSHDLESSTRACVSHWLGLIYGEGWTEQDLIYDPISSIRAPDTLSVPELQEAQRRFSSLRPEDSASEEGRVIEGLGYMVDNRIGFRAFSEGFSFSYRQAIETVMAGRSVSDSMLYAGGSEYIYDAATYRILRNAVFARHGRAFASADLHDFFYGPEAVYRFRGMGIHLDAQYSDDRLTPTDRANIERIRAYETRASESEP